MSDLYERAVNSLYKLIPNKDLSKLTGDYEQILKMQQRLLAQVTDFLSFAGAPQDQFRSVHIAGTSGKGSVAMMVAALMKTIGLKVGTHTNPYLQICHEKLMIDRALINTPELVMIIERFHRVHEAWLAQQAEKDAPFAPLSYYQAWTAIAFLWFAKQHVPWAVIETGAGGRYASSNVLQSELAIITHIGWDHIHILGPTLRDVAYHKAGIIKEGQIVVTGEENRELLEIIEEEAAVKGAKLYRLNKEFFFSLKEGSISISIEGKEYTQITPNLKGDFQLWNAGLAIVAVHLLAQKYEIELTSAQMQAGLSTLSFPGRMELVSEEPLVILDGAHNKDKIAAVAAAIKTLYPDKKLHLLIGMLKNREPDDILHPLLSQAVRATFVAPDVYGRPAIAAEQLMLSVLDQAGGMPMTAWPTAEQGLENALSHLGEDDLLLVTGSLYLVGALRNHWYPVSQLLVDLA